jgi:hypothetical protein
MLFPNGMKVCLAGCAWRARGKRVRAHRMQSDSAPTAPARGCIFGPSGVAELSSDDDSLRRCACERGFCFGKVFLTNRKRICIRTSNYTHAHAFIFNHINLFIVFKMSNASKY